MQPGLALTGIRLSIAPARYMGLPTLRKKPSSRATPITPVGPCSCICRFLRCRAPAFPEFLASRHPHPSFRGLLRIHCTLRPVRSLPPSRRHVSPGLRSTGLLQSTARVATESNRPLLRWNSHPLVPCTLVAHKNFVGVRSPLPCDPTCAQGPLSSSRTPSPPLSH